MCANDPTRSVTIVRFEESSPAHVVVYEGKHVGLPYDYAEMEKVVPLIHGVTDRRIDLQAMRYHQTVSR